MPEPIPDYIADHVARTDAICAKMRADEIADARNLSRLPLDRTASMRDCSGYSWIAARGD